MPAPSRYFQGITQDQTTQPLGQIGVPNPFFYNVFEDDFDFFSNQKFNTLLSSTGTVAATPADGGAILHTTAATAADFVGIQGKVASFAMIPQTSSIAGKKAAFVTRIRLSDVVNGGFIVGLVNTAANPYTGTTDGIFISKATGSTQIVGTVRTASVSATVNIPYTMVNAQDVDLAWYHDGRGRVAFGASPMFFGFQPNSGTGATVPVLFPTAALDPANGAFTVPTALLNVTASVQAGNGTVTTMQQDLIGAFRER